MISLQGFFFTSFIHGAELLKTTYNLWSLFVGTQMKYIGITCKQINEWVQPFFLDMPRGLRDRSVSWRFLNLSPAYVYFLTSRTFFPSYFPNLRDEDQYPATWLEKRCFPTPPTSSSSPGLCCTTVLLSLLLRTSQHTPPVHSYCPIGAPSLLLSFPPWDRSTDNVLWGVGTAGGVLCTRKIVN